MACKKGGNRKWLKTVCIKLRYQAYLCMIGKDFYMQKKKKNSAVFFNSWCLYNEIYAYSCIYEM